MPSLNYKRGRGVMDEDYILLIGAGFIGLVVY